MIVLDASALLCLLKLEPGWKEVLGACADGCVCSAASWSEVVQKLLRHSIDLRGPRQLVESYGVAIEPVTTPDAELAARLWATMPTLSLADRLCIALATRLGAVAWTADRAWGVGPHLHQIARSAHTD